MKLIIEEGDVGELAPGVYDVEVTSTGIEINFWPSGRLTRKMDVGLSVNLDQTPAKNYVILAGDADALPDARSNYLFNGDLLDAPPGATDMKDYARADAILAKNLWASSTLRAVAQTITWVDLQVGAKVVRIEVGDVIVSTICTMSWTIVEFLSAKAYKCTASNGNTHVGSIALLEEALENGSKHHLTNVAASSATPATTCDKTAANCKQHKNFHNYGGNTNISTGREVHCPHTFGGKSCGVGWVDLGIKPIKPGQTVGDYYNETPYSGATHCGTVYPPGGSPKDCDVCYGTGLYKGFGGPCSEGCPRKGK